MAVHGDDFVCLSDEDGLNHIDSLLESKHTAKDMGTLGFDDSDAKRILLLNRVFKSRDTSNWTVLHDEPDLRHAHLIIKESGCNANTKTVSTSREKLQDKCWCETEERVQF